MSALILTAWESVSDVTPRRKKVKEKKSLDTDVSSTSMITGVSSLSTCMQTASTKTCEIIGHS